MTHAQSLSTMMGPAAAALLGPPNERLSRQTEGVLRFGSQGSIEVNVGEGWFSDYEAGVRGGVLDLIKHKGGAANDAAALTWLENRGIKNKSEPRSPAPAASQFYDYRSESGAVLFRVERKVQDGRKAFLQHGPDGAGGFVCRRGCMQGVRRVLYRLPELLGADQDAVVFVCEGEKDADRLASGGLVATTNPGGAGKFLADFAPPLSGRRVVVLEDNDQAGRDHAADVVAKLVGTAKFVAALRLPGLPDKGDVSDWIAAGGAPADLTRLAEDALARAVNEPRLPLPTLDLAALAHVTPAPKAFAVERLAPLGEVTLFTGPGSAGKSLFGQQLASCAAGGIPCLGLDVMTGPAIYLTCEDDAGQLHWRQSHICRALGLSMSDLAGKLHLISLRGALDNELGTFDAEGLLKPAPAFHRLVAMLTTTGSKLAILDNVAHLFTGNENDRGEVTRFVNLLNRLAGDTGAAIILLGHPNKAGDSYSGSTAWLNAVRSQITVEHDLETDMRTLTVGKANYSRKGEALRFIWNEWAFVLESDLPADDARDLRETVQASADNLLFLTCLRERIRQQRGVSEKLSATYAPKVFATMAESKGIGVKRLEAAMDRLFRINAIGRGPLGWDDGHRHPVSGLRETAGDPS